MTTARVALLCEGQVDQVVVSSLVKAIASVSVEFTEPAPRGRQGYESVKKIFRSVVWWAAQCNADGLVCVVDSDRTPIHREQESHWLQALEKGQPPTVCVEGCRLCALRQAWATHRARTLLCGNRPLRIALGLAVPQIEAWLVDAKYISEFAWQQYSEERRSSVRDRLKANLYGNARGLENKRRIALARVEHLVHSNGINRLAARFPNGFGALQRDLLSWTE